MSYFKKARNYTKPSATLDEKIAKANQEYEKTGVELAEIANSTSGVYYAATENPEIPAEQSEVPDTTGWRDRDPSLPAENASDIDPNDSSTWQTGGMGMDDLINPNSLPVDNGDDVSNQPTVATPDLSGFKSLRTDASDPNSEMASYGGIARTSLLGVWGTTTGVIGNGNKFESVLLAFGWPTGPLVDSHEPGYPSDRSWGGIYRYDDNATYGARLNMRSYMNNLPEGNWLPYKCWMPFNSYGFGQTWTEFSSNPNNIWKHDGNQTLAYVQVSVYAGPGKYNSSQTVPPSTTVLFKDDLGKPENLGIGGKLKGFLENLFGLAGSAAQGLLDAVGDAGDAIGDFIGDTVDDLADRYENIPDFMGPEEAIQDAKDKFQEAWDNFKDFAGQLPPPAVEYSMNIAGSILQNEPVYVNENDIPQSDIDNLVNNIPIGSIQVNNGSAANYADDNIYVDDNGNTHSNIGPNGEKGYYHDNLTGYMGGGTGVAGYGNPLAAAGQAQAQVVIPDDGSPPYFQYTDHAYHNQNSDDPGEVPDAIKAFFSDLVHGAGSILHGNQNQNTGGMSGYPSNSTADIKGDVITQFNVPLDQMPQHVQDYVQTEINYQNMVSSGQIQNPMSGYEHLMPEEKKNRNKTSFLNESNLLMEKNYLRDLREKKREKRKVGDKVMKINIPGPKDELTVKAIDMLRQYKVSEKEMQEYATIIGQINQWIRDNPKEYAIWKVRYPAKDPRTAELNWRLDQQLRSSDEYMETHFPENEKLFRKLKNKIATNVDVTDPRNYKDVKPAVTHKQLLKVSKALGEESIKWNPLSTGIANKTTQTFGLYKDFFGTEIPELGQDGNEVTATFGGLGGVESQPSQFEYKAQEGNSVTVSPPTYKSLSLAGYAKPLPWKMARKKNAKKAEEINTQLDSSEDFTKEIKADALMKARVEEWEEKINEIQKHNQSINRKIESLEKRANKIKGRISDKYRHVIDMGLSKQVSMRDPITGDYVSDERMEAEYMAAGGRSIERDIAALEKQRKEEPAYPVNPNPPNLKYEMWKFSQQSGQQSDPNEVFENNPIIDDPTILEDPNKVEAILDQIKDPEIKEAIKEIMSSKVDVIAASAKVFGLYLAGKLDVINNEVVGDKYMDQFIKTQKFQNIDWHATDESAGTYVTDGIVGTAPLPTYKDGMLTQTAKFGFNTNAEEMSSNWKKGNYTKQGVKGIVDFILHGGYTVLGDLIPALNYSIDANVDPLGPVGPYAGVVASTAISSSKMFGGAKDIPVKLTYSVEELKKKNKEQYDNLVLLGIIPNPNVKESLFKKIGKKR